jgi:hypothetical protein
MDSLRLPLCSRSWTVALFPDTDIPTLMEVLPRLLHHVESEGLVRVHHRSAQVMSPAVRAAFTAAHIRSAEASQDHCPSARAHFVLAPAAALA